MGRKSCIPAVPAAYIDGQGQETVATQTLGTTAPARLALPHWLGAPPIATPACRRLHRAPARTRGGAPLSPAPGLHGVDPEGSESVGG